MMEGLKEAVQYLYELRPLASLEKVGELNYVKNATGFSLLYPPLPAGVELTTLSGLVDLLASEIDGKKPDVLGDEYFFQVVDHLNVSVVCKKADAYGRRDWLAKAKAVVPTGMTFGQFMAPENFIITLASGFVPSDELAKLIELCYSLTSESSTEAVDDGISQNVVVKNGAALKRSAETRPRVTLAPYRTFSEAEQPASDFIFRVQKGTEGRPPNCALFEADGGAWKQKAMRNIMHYLTSKAVSLKVVA